MLFGALRVFDRITPCVAKQVRNLMFSRGCGDICGSLRDLRSIASRRAWLAKSHALLLSAGS